MPLGRALPTSVVCTSFFAARVSAISRAYTVVLLEGPRELEWRGALELDKSEAW